MFERYTDRARKVMALANQEAQRLNHEYVGTEHILLGLVKEGSGVGATVLKNLGVELRTVRLEVERLVKAGPDMVFTGKLHQTPRAKKVGEYAIEEARTLNHNYVGTEHLLLGLLRQTDCKAFEVLNNLGLEVEKVREKVLDILVDPDLQSVQTQQAASVSTPVVLTKPEMDQAVRILLAYKVEYDETEGHVSLKDLDESAPIRYVWLNVMGGSYFDGRIGSQQQPFLSYVLDSGDAETTKNIFELAGNILFQDELQNMLAQSHPTGMVLHKLIRLNNPDLLDTIFTHLEPFAIVDLLRKPSVTENGVTALDILAGSSQEMVGSALDQLSPGHRQLLFTGPDGAVLEKYRDVPVFAEMTKRLPKTPCEITGRLAELDAVIQAARERSQRCRF